MLSTLFFFPNNSPSPSCLLSHDYFFLGVIGKWIVIGVDLNCEAAYLLALNVVMRLRCVYCTLLTLFTLR